MPALAAPPQSSGREPSLDGVRFLAALVVVIFHSRIGAFQGGWLGVEIFLVLSGYLIATILGRRAPIGRGTFVEFLARRIRRLLPLLLVVSVAFVLASLLYGRTGLSSEVLPAITFTANFFAASGSSPGWLLHTWSLALEMQFYIVIASAFLLLRLRPSIGLAVSLFSIWAALTLLRFPLLAEGEFSARMLSYHPLFRGSGLFLGAAFAFLPSGAVRKIGHALPLAVLLFALSLGTAVERSPSGHLVFLPMAEVATAILLAYLLTTERTSPLRTILSHPFLSWLGERSYGIYLWHYPIVRALRTELDAGTVLLVALPLSIVLAIISHRFVETLFYRPAAPNVIRPLSRPV